MRTTVYQQWSTLIKIKLKYFSLTTKDGSNPTPKEKLDTVVFNVVILKNDLLCESLWSWKLHSIYPSPNI